MDRRLLDILCCPATGQPLAMLRGPELDAINGAIGSGELRRQDGSVEAATWQSGLLTENRRIAYRIEDGIPVLLVDESISTERITDFPA